MDEFENLLARSLREGPRPDAGKHEAARKEALQMFEHKIRVITIYTWIAIAVSTAMILGGVAGILAAPSAQQTVMFAVLFFCGVELQVLMKLWYWTVHSRITLQKDLKEFEMRLMERLPPGEGK
ncbi:MAG: hypothetical protein NTX87_14870 [Planctomycetota bacterium]|nr:hypothetical protein [Planctomycetota bacterium]